ncbi:hypothetical protein L195_g051943 [Trifolium pratense]|uniref:Uncharacterized protein n=1 Tax=Trifolium pratense TaxID=57577 RepID=A0A2K3K2E1_TRIPR|nr:hypothetical protein L195_g051943 [Trifolium pratense]
MAGLPTKIRVPLSDVKAAALWGVTAGTAALYLVQDSYAIPYFDPHIRSRSY